MRASEILHGLAELMAGIEGGQSAPGQEPQSANSAQLTTVANVAPQTPEADNTTMVFPLQQKMELLKKSLNVDNEFDQGFDQIDQEEGKSEQPQEQPDELARMKEMAGIKQVAIQELASDEPLDI